MKIANYALTLQSDHSRAQQSSVTENLRMWVDVPPRRSASAEVQLSLASQQKLANAAAKVDDASQAVANDPKSQLLMLLIEKMTGRKVQVFNLSELNASEQAAIADSAQINNAPRAGYGLEYSKVSRYSEYEQTHYQAAGTLKTADGKDIQFHLNITMQRQYSETSATTLRLGDAVRMTDPLVINFNGPAAELSDQRFAFDLDSDGSPEQINALQPGSGFLALDKNGDGHINNGGELFGPTSNDGFNELKNYDDNRDNWLDENDAAFDRLRVWTDSHDGSGQLTPLKSLNIGAIYLEAASTPFDIKNADNELLGAVRTTSVAVKEDGWAVSVQQIDLTA